MEQNDILMKLVETNSTLTKEVMDKAVKEIKELRAENKELLIRAVKAETELKQLNELLGSLNDKLGEMMGINLQVVDDKDDDNDENDNNDDCAA